MVQYIPFREMIWPCVERLLISCRNSYQRKRTNYIWKSRDMSNSISCNSDFLNIVITNDKLSLWIQSRNQGTIVIVKNLTFPRLKKCNRCSHHQNDYDHFMIFMNIHEYSPQSQNSTKYTTNRFCATFMTLCHISDQTFGNAPFYSSLKSSHQCNCNIVAQNGWSIQKCNS